MKIGFRKLFFNKEIAICVLTLFGATAATAKDASEIFRAVCAVCHGKEGEGKRVLGPALKGNEFITKGTDAEIKATIKDGRSFAIKKYKDFPAPMPAQKVLTDVELDALVKYLKDLNGIAPLNAEESVPLPLPVAPEQRQEEANEHKESFGFEDLIGKEFTASKLIGQRKDKSIEKFIHRYLDYYVSLDDFKEKRMNNKESFIVSEIVPQGFSQYYKIKFKSGKEGYIEVNKLAEGLSIFYECGNCENIGKPSGEILLEAVERGNGVETLKERGVSKGSYLWLKYSRFDLPWLAKVRITDCTLKMEAPPLKLLLEVDGKEIQFGFYLYGTKGECQSTPDWACFDDTFYVTDPAPRIAKWGKRVLTAIKENKVFIGMTKEQVRASWGVPDDNNRTVGPWGVHEQWIYGDNGSYLYFQNDKLTSWQD